MDEKQKRTLFILLGVGFMLYILGGLTVAFIWALTT